MTHTYHTTIGDKTMALNAFKKSWSQSLDKGTVEDAVRTGERGVVILSQDGRRHYYKW